MSKLKINSKIIWKKEDTTLTKIKKVILKSDGESQ